MKREKKSGLDSAVRPEDGLHIAEQCCHARVYKVYVPDLVPAIKVPAVHHIPSPGASTAKEKDSAGPAQERRDSGTLYDIASPDTAPGLRRRALFILKI